MVKILGTLLNPVVYHAKDLDRERLYGYSFWCPGCNESHIIITDTAERIHWSFNSNFASPTFSPSLGVYSDEYLNGTSPIKYKCHLFIEYGRIKYLSDCKHEYVGQTIDMVKWPNGD